jgi:tetratricopeptide (TPR) repeat protein
MTERNALTEFKEGMDLLKNGYPKKALPHFHCAVEVESHNPYYLSFLGLSIGRAEKKWKDAISLCETARRLKPNEVQLYLNLAEVYASAGQRENAIDTLDRALQIFGRDARLRRARSRVEKRRSPVLFFLERSHFLNRGLGKLRHRALVRLRKS